MIHQVQGLTIGSLREMEDTLAEVSRNNRMLFKIIQDNTKVSEEQLNDVLNNKKDWFLTADEALSLIRVYRKSASEGSSGVNAAPLPSALGL